ncbi:phosphatidate phosphatase LPIN1 isoform X2 [Callorhinchus milii]|uniref:phosphatidate phosphatase n=1 Tax=Callorhinchus milii TaxID=7868 RepID=A0A4W3I5N4_CALMI|nr:phosphatidate phosphatase LPIN1 isoform X2 [Callorhinchus milii]|eukprot:gi/632958814/ref/XP_007895256.1/ PREDICTED: phosphatidate phosphatase LPIN1 isoform X2 [Callorhinchus milii]
MTEEEKEEEITYIGSPTEFTWAWVKTQTMNYVGQLAGQVFVTVKDLYKGLNPATLSGCIDIIVVRQPDGSLQCSPFHVRFGKLGVLRSKEKVVDIEINGEPVQLHMKLGDNGEAFFVEEMASNKEIVPFHLNTSPIMSEGAVLMETAMRRSSLDKQKNLESSQIPTNSHNSQPSPESLIGSNSVKKRRKRRRKSKVDSIKRDDNDDTSENEDMFSIEISSEEEIESTENSRVSINPYSDESSQAGASLSFTQTSMYAYSDGERFSRRSQLVEGNWLSTHLIGPAAEGLSSSCPQQPSLYPSMFSLTGSRPPTPNSDSELVSKPSDRGMQLNSQMHWAWGELPHTGKPITHQKVEEPPRVNIIPSGNTHFRVIDSAPIVSSSSAPLMLVKPEPLAAGETLPTDSFTHGAEEPFEALATGCQMMPENGEQSHPGDHIKPIGKTDSPSKKKDKRSHHLGADGVYLDDITELDPEVAALYFPKCENNPANRSENGTRSESQSPQSVGSSGMDSGVDSFSDTIGDLPTIAISLCGGLNDNKEITKEQFVERSVTYQQFSENPGILEDPNLVVKIGTKYYNWSTAAPMLLAAQAFQKPLPKATVENLLKEKMPKKGGRWWFSWRGRNSSVKVEPKHDQIRSGHVSDDLSAPPGDRLKDESSSSDDELRSAKQHCSSSQQDLTLLSPASYISYKKTLRLTSEELKSLQLKDGPNDVVFSVTTQYQGTCRCEGTIYLWNWNDRIVISDIDGTITRSDALGHILPTLGKDWTHQGIAKLYHKVSQNGYKFLYCSARAIGMADMTRGYLHWVNEKGTVLPKGPLLLCPSSVFSALHREVIEKKPEKFKIQCLTDIRNLFFPNKEPFYGAFGNRPNDVYSYKQVGVPINRIFTVNPKGELIQEHAKTNVSSYVRLSEIVDHVFPLLKREHSSDFPCSDTYSQFTFWREQLPMVENQDIQASQN